MKIQEVKKECLANVGLSIEFSNSEVDSIVQLIWDLGISIEKGYGDLAEMKQHTDHINPDKATVTVDLKTLVRCQWLLNKITNDRANNPSSIFDKIDSEYRTIVESINMDLI